MIPKLLVALMFLVQAAPAVQNRPVGVKVRGIVVRPAEQPGPSTIRVSLGRQYGSSIQVVDSAEDGSFEFSNVPSGALFLWTEFPTSSIAVAVVVSDRDVNGVQVRVPRILPTTLRITVEGGGPIPRLSVTSSAINMNTANGLPSHDGSLSVKLPEGEQYLSFGNLPSGYFVRSIRYGTVDLLKEKLNLPAAGPREILVTLGTVQPRPWFSLRGRVIGSATQVFAYHDQSEYQTPVNPDGSFEFSKLLPGRYGFRLTSGDFATVMADVVDKNVEGVEIVARRFVTLSGRILMQGSGPPPRFVNLVFADATGRNGGAMPQFNPDGSFNVRIAEGEYRVDVSGFPATYSLKSITYGAVNLLQGPIKVDDAAPRELLLTLATAQPAERKVRGRVIGHTNQVLVAKKVVLTESAVKDFETSVAADGSFSFSGVPPGKYVVTFNPSVPGATFARISVDAQDVTGVELRVPKLATLSGQVVVDGGVPLPRFPIRFSGPAGTFIAWCDPQGNFTTSIPEGDHQVSLSALIAAGSAPESLPPGYRVKAMMFGPARIDQQLRIAATNTARLVITLQAMSFNVSGRVLGLPSAPAGRPRQGPPPRALLSSERSSGLPNLSVDLRPDGTFVFEKVPVGIYMPRVIPDIVGFVPNEIRVIDRDITGVEFRMPRLVEVKGRVVLEAGMIMPRFSLELVGGTRRMGFFVSMNPDGTFTAEIPEGEQRLDVGSFSPAVQLKAFTYGTTNLRAQPVRFTGPSAATLTISFGVAGTWHRVSGRVIGGDILPPLWRHVRLEGSYFDGLDILPAANGSFVFPKVPPGEYTLRVNAPSHMGTSTPVRLQVDRDIPGVELRVERPVAR